MQAEINQLRKDLLTDAFIENVEKITVTDELKLERGDLTPPKQTFEIVVADEGYNLKTFDADTLRDGYNKVLQHYGARQSQVRALQSKIVKELNLQSARVRAHLGPARWEVVAYDGRSVVSKFFTAPTSRELFAQVQQHYGKRNPTKEERLLAAIFYEPGEEIALLKELLTKETNAKEVYDVHKDGDKWVAELDDQVYEGGTPFALYRNVVHKIGHKHTTPLQEALSANAAHYQEEKSRIGEALGLPKNATVSKILATITDGTPHEKLLAAHVTQNGELYNQCLAKIAHALELSSGTTLDGIVAKCRKLVHRAVAFDNLESCVYHAAGVSPPKYGWRDAVELLQSKAVAWDDVWKRLVAAGMPVEDGAAFLYDWITKTAEAYHAQEAA